jgi:hypothetical protein
MYDKLNFSVDIHSEYEKIAVVMKYRSINLRTFQRQWHDLCLHIVITKHCTDLCQKCQEFAGRISKSGNIAVHAYYIQLAITIFLLQ